MRSVVAAAVVLLFGCAPRLDVGAACALASECPDPLVCLLGRCRSECETYRDCELGQSCLLDGASGARACRTAPELECAAASDCGEGLACVEGRCAQICDDVTDCGGTVCLGDPAATRICVEPTGDSCTGDADCAFGPCEGGVCDPARSLAAGAESTCVQLESGRLVCAGHSTMLLFASGADTFWPGFTPLRDESGMPPLLESISLGSYHACALSAGRARCWGSGARGQNGAAAPAAPIPGGLASPTGILEISAALQTTCVRTATDVFCFGADDLGQLGDDVTHPGSFPGSPTPVRAELLYDGSPVRPLSLDVGGYHGCAVVEGSHVLCWGNNEHHQVNDGTGEPCTFSGRTVTCFTTPVAMPGFGPTTIVARSVAVGIQHTCVLDAVGAVYCWGESIAGQTGGGSLEADVPVPARAIAGGVVEIDAGARFTCARYEDGTVACWGSNEDGQLGGGGGIRQPTPMIVDGLSDIVDIATGADHTCALDRRGAVYCWGRADHGRLGEDPMGAELRPDVSEPTRVRMGPMGF